MKWKPLCSFLAKPAGGHGSARVCSSVAQFERVQFCRLMVSNMGPFSSFSRRQLLSGLGGGFGLFALRSVCGAAENPFAPKAPHFAPKAKHVIFLFMNGGMSQVDTFDPKPMLAKYNGQAAPGGNPKTERKTGSLMQSPFAFRKCGQSGIEVSEIFPKIGDRIDDICVIRSMYTDIPNHEPSLQMMNCGENLQSRPSMGSWLLYGLGTENQDLPGYVVMCPGMPVVGSPLWNSSFLPAVYQGVHIPNNVKDPREMIRYLRDTTRSSRVEASSGGFNSTIESVACRRA